MAETEEPPRPPDIHRRTLTTFGYAVTIAVPVLIAAIGLVLLRLNYDDDDLVAGTRVPLLTSDWEDGDDGADAALSGEVTLSDDGCVLVGDTTVVWPRDFVASRQEVGRGEVVKVYDPDRAVVASSGQTVETGGAYADVGEYAGRPCAPDAGEVFLVQAEVTVVPGS